LLRTVAQPKEQHQFQAVSVFGGAAAPLVELTPAFADASVHLEALVRPPLQAYELVPPTDLPVA
jgi:hypothetical protein